MGASALAGCGSSSRSNGKYGARRKESQEQATPAEESKAQGTTAKETASEEKEPVELTLWVTSRNSDDWSTEMENKFLEEHPWITLNKVVKEGDPGNEFYQAVGGGHRSGSRKLFLYHDEFLYGGGHSGAAEPVH